MANPGDGIYAKGEEGVAIELRDEFIADSADNVRALDVALEDARQGNISMENFVDKSQRVILPLCGQAGNYGIRLLGTVAHRFEDYISNVKPSHPTFVNDIQKFIDTLIDILEETIPFDSDASSVVRKLPVKSTFEVGDIEVRNVEVMLVMLHGTATHFVEREMQQCGYRTTTVTSTFDAMPMIIRTKPDFVIISAMMPELDGIDLAVGLSAMPSTRNIPLALITSLDKDDPHLQFLPQKVPVIHKGPSFGDDLADALENLFLI